MPWQASWRPPGGHTKCKRARCKHRQRVPRQLAGAAAPCAPCRQDCWWALLDRSAKNNKSRPPPAPNHPAEEALCALPRAAARRQRAEEEAAARSEQGESGLRRTHTRRQRADEAARERLAWRAHRRDGDGRRLDRRRAGAGTQRQRHECSAATRAAAVLARAAVEGRRRRQGHAEGPAVFLLGGACRGPVGARRRRRSS